MPTTKKILHLFTVTIALFLAGCSADKQPETSQAIPAVTAAEARTIAREAYVYGFPMVIQYKTLYNYVIDTAGKEYKGPFNEIACDARLFTPADKTIVTPNSDTPYCMFWMDLRAEPMVLTVPELSPERFYHFQLVDLYTHNYAYVGTLSTGNNSGRYLIAGPDWEGEMPEGITAVLSSETSLIFNITRTQLFGNDDLERVREIQESYELQPLSAFLGTEVPVTPVLPNLTEWVEGSQFDERFFEYFDAMLTILEQPGDGEAKLWEQLARLGIGSEDSFDFSALPEDIQEALRTGVQDGVSDIEKMLAEAASDPLGSSKVFGTREFLTRSAQENYGHENSFLIRATAAYIGVFGNSAAEAIYPSYMSDSNGQPFDASKNSYKLVFPAGQLPPVNAFWSLSMYDGPTQLFIDNSLDRYLLNSGMLDDFKLEEDGSLVLHVAKESPGAGLEANWLPAPDGPFYMVLRLYGPQPEALAGEWTPPELQKIE